MPTATTRYVWLILSSTSGRLLTALRRFDFIFMMNFYNYPPRAFAPRLCRFFSILALFALTFAPLSATHAAQTSAPAAATVILREQLLNGLNVLLLPRPDDPRVLLKLRVNSGAVFDLAGREGTMRLLADALFPDPATREYVTEELGGKLDVAITYDHLDITLNAPVAQFERLVELLRGAVVNPRFAPEDVQRLRAERLKQTGQSALQPSALADRLVLARLFGQYPYGRDAAGTPEGFAHVGRADLLAARDRLLVPNNSTLVCVGGVERSRAMRAFRQYLGIWRRADNLVPATFRQPEVPDRRTRIEETTLDLQTAEVRLAVRGLARADRQQSAANILAAIAAERLRGSIGALPSNAVSVRHDAYALSGVFLVSAHVPVASSAQTLAAMHQILRTLAATPVSSAELEAARTQTLAAMAQRADAAEAETRAADLLDAERYQTTAADEAQAVRALRATDLQRVAARLFQNALMASVVVGDRARLETDLANVEGGIESVRLGDPVMNKPGANPATKPTNNQRDPAPLFTAPPKRP